MVLGWNIPVGSAYCVTQANQSVTCNYTNPPPLVPNYDVVTKAWWGAFLTTSWSTSIVSIALIICEYYLWAHPKPYSPPSNFPPAAPAENQTNGSDPDPENTPQPPADPLPIPQEHHHPVERTIIVLERLINAFSDQQSVAGLSLIVVAGHDGCELSAYIYNLICFQLIMSIISHLNALTNTRNWFGDPNTSFSFWRGIFAGCVKIVPIILTIMMSGVMLGARIGSSFPSSAGNQAALPAVCFENVNGLAGPQAIGELVKQHKADWASNGFIQYLILVLDLIIIGFIFSIALLKKIKHRPDGFRMKISLILRSVSTVATTGTLVWLSVSYIEMRQNMEGNPLWYDGGGVSNQYSFYNVVTWAMFVSSLVPVAKAFAEAYKKPDLTDPTGMKLLRRESGQLLKAVENADGGKSAVIDQVEIFSNSFAGFAQ
ncbi:hypothetical protein G7Y89_g8482 [Cudoniella acicularis]|uniref:Uncharacterized protein n=1 Tax=Cudoniella acicularis TaxID=354080 RepID=A0A8H4RJ18_9HELO|nr:hypothetical protein G7Y89_g8482 [Cudoniella acicularis]